jgi:hypothetical protein
MLLCLVAVANSGSSRISVAGAEADRGGGWRRLLGEEGYSAMLPNTHKEGGSQRPPTREVEESAKPLSTERYRQLGNGEEGGATRKRGDASIIRVGETTGERELSRGTESVERLGEDGSETRAASLPVDGTFSAFGGKIINRYRRKPPSDTTNAAVAAGRGAVDSIRHASWWSEPKRQGDVTFAIYGDRKDTDQDLRPMMKFWGLQEVSEQSNDWNSLWSIQWHDQTTVADAQKPHKLVLHTPAPPRRSLPPMLTSSDAHFLDKRTFLSDLTCPRAIIAYISTKPAISFQVNNIQHMSKETLGVKAAFGRSHQHCVKTHGAELCDHVPTSWNLPRDKDQLVVRCLL